MTYGDEPRAGAPIAGPGTPLGATGPTPTDQTRSAREVLVEWANHQDGWVRTIVSEVLATRRELSETSLLEIKGQYLLEKQLVDGPAPTVPPLSDCGVSGEVCDDLRLVSLTQCRGVNALAPGQAIVFSPVMTILFGENATGKTGYVRLLKRLASVRSAETIIPDIHRQSPPVAPHAVVAYELGGKVAPDVTWEDEEGVPPFTRMTVFDSPAVALHLEDSVTYYYTPADLALFKYTNSAITGIKGMLEAEVATRSPRQNPFLTSFSRDTPMYPKIESLGPGTSLAELDALALVTDAERTELASLRETVATLSGSADPARRQSLKSHESILANLITIAEAVPRFEAHQFAVALAAESVALAEQSAAAAAVFGGGQLPSTLQPAWREFLESGERYLVASDQVTYPAPGDLCLYCRQQLSAASLALLKAYRDYASGATAGAVRVASAAVSGLQQALTSPMVAGAVEALHVLLPGVEGGESEPDWAPEGRQLVTATTHMRDGVVARTSVDATEVTGLSRALLPRLRAAQREAAATLKALDGDAEEKAGLLRDARARVQLLDARLNLARLLPEVRSYVAQAKWVSAMRTLLPRFQGLLRGLTEASKVASEDILNKDFERVFLDECRALRAPNVLLDFPGRRGEAARRKSVAPDHSLAEILSEGEQKVIAIADFLAEASLRLGSAPIVFDDPVNSLDHRRVGEIAKRIAALSGKQQVIVFTHDIWFAAGLLAEFETHPKDCLYYQVAAESGRPGLVAQASNSRLDTVPKIEKRIYRSVQEAQAATGAERESKIDEAYSHIRAWCELAVEVDLLAKVTQRFQPNVAMQNLGRIRPDRLGAAAETLFEIWDRANRYITAHSQPLDTLAVRPTLDELREDWAKLQQALKDYRAD